MKRLAMRSAAQASAVFRFPAHSIAGRAGTSLKHEHLQAILADEKRDRFFEVHAENYMGAGGPPHAALNRIRHDYPVSLHGVCMSIGGPQPLDETHLGRFKALSTAMSRRSFPSISPGQPTARPISTICCRSPTQRRRWLASPIT